MKPLFLRRLAFTLAEVLIVIGIIGIIADMTIPTLVSSYQEKVTVVRVKQSYSILSEAYKLTEFKYGTPDMWELTGTTEDVTSNTRILEYFTESIKTTAKCLPKTDGTPCFPNVTYKTLDGGNYSTFNSVISNYGRAYAANGMSLLFHGCSPTCSANFGNSQSLQNVCARIVVDVNGFKGPNQNGKDLFFFHVTKFGVIPMGDSQTDSALTANNFYDRCNRTKTGTYNGMGCAAWVIYNGNMDYLRCDDLSWGGKTKCN